VDTLTAANAALQGQVDDLTDQLAIAGQTIVDLETQIASMFTQEQVDQAIRDVCPGNSEYKGRPDSPGGKGSGPKGGKGGKGGPPWGGKK